MDTARARLRRLTFGHGFLALALLAAVLTLTFNRPLAGLLASATSSLADHPATVFFTPYAEQKFMVGDTFDVDVNVNARTPINALGATIVFPPETIEILGISKKRSFFDLWTEETVIKEAAGQIHFSGGTTHPGGMIGTGTVITLSIRAKQPGEAQLTVSELQVLAHDGRGTQLDANARTFTYDIEEAPAGAASASPQGSTWAPAAGPAAPSADFDGNGRITLVDVSILTVRLLLPYDTRYDLDTNGSVGLSDLSILFSQM